MQTFSGWPNNQFPSPKDKLSKLNLPNRFKLNLTTGEESNQELNGRYIDIVSIVTRHYLIMFNFICFFTFF